MKTISINRSRLAVVSAIVLFALLAMATWTWIVRPYEMQFRARQDLMTISAYMLNDVRRRSTTTGTHGMQSLLIDHRGDGCPYSWRMRLLANNAKYEGDQDLADAMAMINTDQPWRSPSNSASAERISRLAFSKPILGVFRDREAGRLYGTHPDGALLIRWTGDLPQLFEPGDMEIDDDLRRFRVNGQWFPISSLQGSHVLQFNGSVIWIATSLSDSAILRILRGSSLSTSLRAGE